MKIFKIQLSNLRFFSKIGVFPQERKVGNEFIVDVEVTIDASAFKREELDSTISYADIYELVKEQMGRESLLLETVAVKIAETFKDRWPQIKEGIIKLHKITPPIPGIEGNCGIEYLF